MTYKYEPDADDYYGRMQVAEERVKALELLCKRAWWEDHENECISQRTMDRLKLAGDGKEFGSK